ncbi:MAG: hypothetical protein RLN96_09085 [Pseudomonadales bacterium]
MDAIMLLIQQFRRFYYLLVFAPLVACADYSFNINNNQVYSPPRLFNDYRIADPGLHDCIQQTIFDQKITAPEELEILTCSNAGITSLDGISQFSRLTRINLKSNLIENVDELLQLTYLEDLDISDNPIENCQTLSQLETVVTGRLVHDKSCP